jgi:hypothetical protein
MIKRYLPVTSVTSDWAKEAGSFGRANSRAKPLRSGGPFYGSSLNGCSSTTTRYRSSGRPEAPKDRQVVTIELRDVGARKEVLVTERNNKNVREFEHSEGSWRMVLNGLKALVEGTSVAPTGLPKLRT